jgi:glycosyltransferase involved in cell wall biosynthesis
MGLTVHPSRIALISHRFQQNDGQGRVNYEVVKAALERGYHVTILATSCAPDIAEHPRTRFVQIGNDRLPTELLRNIVFANGSARWLRKHRHELDLVQANGFVTWEPCDVVAAHFVHAAWAKSSWYPFRSLKPYALYQRLYTTLNCGWEKGAFLRARRVIAVSKPLVKELAEIGVDTARIEVVWNGVDTEQFHPGPGDRAAFGLPLDVPMGLFVGDIRTPRKNLDTVLHAMQSVPEMTLAVAGAVGRSPYPAMARALGVAERVYFLDKVTAMPLLMRSVDMFVFPSRYEPFGLVVVEAMASGLASVVSGTFGAADFLGAGGVIVEDPNDANALAAAMQALASDPGRRMAMGAAGRERSLAMQWSAMADRYMEIFEEELGQRQMASVG